MGGASQQCSTQCYTGTLVASVDDAETGAEGGSEISLCFWETKNHSTNHQNGDSSLVPFALFQTRSSSDI